MIAQLPADEAVRRRLREDFDTTFFVEAGAGTGKTTTLVDRIVALVASGRLRAPELVAITFTEAAAAELRARVRDELGRVCRKPARLHERDDVALGGSGVGTASILLLKGLGLTPKDVTITQVGGEGTRIAALKGGSVGCAVVGISKKGELTPLGLNVVFDLSTAKLQWGRSGLMARTDSNGASTTTTPAEDTAVRQAQLKRAFAIVRQLKGVIRVSRS